MLAFGCWMLDVGCWMLGPALESQPSKTPSSNQRQGVGGPAAPKLPIERSPTFPSSHKAPTPPLDTPSGAPTSKTKYPTSPPSHSRPHVQKSSQSSRSHSFPCDEELGSGESDVSLWVLDVRSRTRKSAPKDPVVQSTVGRRRPCRAQDPIESSPAFPNGQ